MPDGRVGHLQLEGVAGDGDDPTDGDDGEDQQRRQQRQVGRQLEHEAVRLVGQQVLFEEELDPVGQGLQQAPKGPARLGPIRFCMSEMTLRSNQIISITRDEQHAERRRGP